MFEQLVKNIKSDGALESAPLLFQNEELKEKGKYEIISGHHRVDAAKAAGIPFFVAFVRFGISREALVSKQLSHNALTGKDDQQILKELFDSISDIDLRFASGLQDEIGKVHYESLNFKVGTFKSFMILFTPPDYEEFQTVLDQIGALNMTGDETEVRLAAMDSHPQFIDSIQRIKKVENIKSNAIALHRMMQLAAVGLKALEDNKEEADKEKAELKAEEKKAKKSSPKQKVNKSLDEI